MATRAATTRIAAAPIQKTRVSRTLAHAFVAAAFSCLSAFW